MKDTDLLPFGKYKGQKLEDIPASYLLWFMEQEWSAKQWPDLHAYCKKNYKAIEHEIREEEEENQIILENAIDSGHW